MLDERERLALEYASAVTRTRGAEDELFARVSERFREEKIIELSAIIAFEMCVATFNRALQIEAAGACRLPARDAWPGR
jgi:alkylhydroperoxidase family enzyme